MEFESFITVDKSRHIRTGEGYDNEITLSGSHIFPLEQPIPIITKGSGCYYIGMITEITIRKTSTTIRFVATKTTANQGKVFYGFFQNVMSTKEEDSYEQTDTIIPGAMGKINRIGDSNEIPRRGKSDTGSLSDYLDDDYYDDW